MSEILMDVFRFLYWAIYDTYFMAVWYSTPIVIGAIFFKKMDEPIRWIFAILVFSFLSDFTGKVLVIYGYWNMWLNHVCITYEHAAIMLALYTLPFEFPLKRYIKYTAPGCIILWIILHLTEIEVFFWFAEYSSPLHDITTLIYLSAVCYELYLDDGTINYKHFRPVFLALFIFFIVCNPVNIMKIYLPLNYNTLMTIGSIHRVVNLVMMTMLGYGFWRVGKYVPE